MSKFWYWRIYYIFIPLGLILLIAGIILYINNTKEFSEVNGYFSFYDKNNEYVENCDCRMLALNLFLEGDKRPYYSRNPNKIEKTENFNIEKGQLVHIFHKNRRIKQLIVNEENVFRRNVILPLILIIFGAGIVFICVFYMFKGLKL